MRELAFVFREGQNAFFTELATTLRDELRELGVPTTTSLGWPPPAEGRAYVLVAPHEHAILAGPRGLPAAVLPRTVCVCTEQPGTTWFDRGARVASRCGAALDINGRGVEELRRRGVPAHTSSSAIRPNGTGTRRMAIRTSTSPSSAASPSAASASWLSPRRF